jgi:hypothetical protein
VQVISLSHFVGQELVLTELVNGTMLISLSGDPVIVQKTGSAVTVDNQAVSAAVTVSAADCVFHELQGVIVPSTISSAARQAGRNRLDDSSSC